MEINEENGIVIDFSGWLRVAPDKVFFQCVEDNFKQRITGTEWLKLDKDTRSIYILENVADAMKEADDLEYNESNVSFDKLS